MDVKNVSSLRTCISFRFYFLSNDELLEILAQTRNPLAVQPHLRKCFDAISKLEFGIDKKPVDTDGATPDTETTHEIQYNNDILAMLSPEGEKVELAKGLKARGNVEDWLGKVEDSMFSSLRKLVKGAIGDFERKEREQWVLDHASQVHNTHYTTAYVILSFFNASRSSSDHNKL